MRLLCCLLSCHNFWLGNLSHLYLCSLLIWCAFLSLVALNSSLIWLVLINFIIMQYSNFPEVGCVFVCVWALWTSWICGFTGFTKFGKKIGCCFFKIILLSSHPPVLLVIQLYMLVFLDHSDYLFLFEWVNIDCSLLKKLLLHLAWIHSLHSTDLLILLMFSPFLSCKVYLKSSYCNIFKFTSLYFCNILFALNPILCVLK